MMMVGKTHRKKSDRLTRRDLQKIQTRERIYNAAKELFVAKGFVETRSGDIAEHAGVSHGSVFTHFKSKSEILERLHNEYLHALIEKEKFKTIEGNSTVARLCAMADMLWEESSLNIKLSRAMLAQSWLWDTEREDEYHAITGKIRNIGEEILIEGKEKGEIPADLDVIVAMNILQAQYRDCLRRAFLSPDNTLCAKNRLKTVIEFICRS